MRTGNGLAYRAIINNLVLALVVLSRDPAAEASRGLRTVGGWPENLARSS